MPPRISPEALAQLPTVTALHVSPDGEQLAFYADWSGRFELYVLHLRTRERRAVTDGQAPKAIRADFIWSRDSRKLYFSRDHDGDERQALYEVEVASGEVRALHHDPQSMDYAADTHPDGSRLLVNSTRGGQMNVHEYDLTGEGEGAWRALTTQPNATSAVAYSPDGSRIGVNTNESSDLRNTDGYVLDTASGELRRVARVREGSQESVGRWHPDGQRIAVSSDADGHGRVGVLHLGSGEIIWLTPEDEATEETPGHFSPDGRWLSVLRSRDSIITPLLYDVETGEARELRLPPGLAAGTEFALGGRHLLFQYVTSTTRPEVWLYDLESDTHKVLIAAEYGAVDPAAFTPSEYVHYPSTDGVQVPAILYKPREMGDGQRLPALIHVHGGPTAQFFRGFDAQAQFLADQGYVVLSPNVRGSTGYGTAWRDANLRDWGGRDLQDVAAGAEYLKSLPYVDGERLGIFGVSYGGYLSYMAAVKLPEVFKVSVPIVGITDLHKLHADNSRVMPALGYYFRTMMGDPEADHDLWRDRSAISHVSQLRAHLFMMHGANDPRCPVNQARDFRDALLALGKREGEDFEYAEFDDEGHGAGDIAGKTRSYRLLADYLARRL